MTGPLLDDFNMAASRLGEYLAVWANPDWKKGEHSKEFTAFMLLKARGEAERCARALLAGRPDGGRELQQISLELDRMFRSNLSMERIAELRDVIVECLDCETLISDLSDYLALSDQYLSSEDDESRRELLFEVTEEGSNLLIRRDELQTVIDQIAALSSLPAMSECQLQTMESHRTRLQKFDSTMRESLWASKPLLSSLKAFRESYGDHVFDRMTYWWWFLDHEAEAQKFAARQIARELSRLRRDRNRQSPRSDYLRIGRLLYQRLVWNTDLSKREPLAAVAHGALNRALILSNRDGEAWDYAEPSYLLALLCRPIAIWTTDVSVAERSLSLLRLAYRCQDSVNEITAAGFPKFTVEDGETLIDVLRRGASADIRPPPRLIPKETMTPPTIDPETALDKLYPRAKAVRGRAESVVHGLAALEDVWAAVKAGYLYYPRLAEARGLTGGEEDKEPLGNLGPGISGCLTWPSESRRSYATLLLTLDAHILGSARRGPTRVVLWTNVCPPKGPAWHEWVLRDATISEPVQVGEPNIEIPITLEGAPVDEAQRRVIRDWVSGSLALEVTADEM